MTFFLTFLGGSRCFLAIYFFNRVFTLIGPRFAKLFWVHFLYSFSFNGVLFSLNATLEAIIFFVLFSCLFNGASAFVFSLLAEFLFSKTSFENNPFFSMLAIGMLLSLTEALVTIFFSIYTPLFFGAFLIQFPFMHPYVYAFSPFIIPFVTTVFCYFLLYSCDKKIFFLMISIIGIGYLFKVLDIKQTNDIHIKVNEFNTNYPSGRSKTDVIDQYTSLHTVVSENKDTFLIFPETYLSTTPQEYFEKLKIARGTYIVRNFNLKQNKKCFNALLVIDDNGKVVFTYKKQLIIPFFEDGLREKIFTLFSGQQSDKKSVVFVRPKKTSSSWIFKDTEIIFLICSDIFKPIQRKTNLERSIIFCSSNHAIVSSMEGKFIARLFLEIQKVSTNSLAYHAANQGYPYKLLYEGS